MKAFVFALALAVAAPVSAQSLAGRIVDAATGLPNVNWGAVPALPPVGAGGAYSVRYVVERMCTVAVITDPLLQCLVKQDSSASNGLNTAKLPDEKLEAPSATQYRVTVRVTGPKDTTTFVQSLLTRG